MSKHNELMDEEQSVLSLEAEQEARGADESQPGGERYEVAPETDRHGTALCLSGGGYRAALFHVGGLRRLNELGILSQVTTISSVSGGSIVNAHIATAIAHEEIEWPDPGEVIDDWDRKITQPLKKLCAKNIRTWAIGHRLFRPWNWLDTSAGVQGLEAQYSKRLTDLELRQLPKRPRFIITATDTVFGVNWIFDSGRNRAGDYQAGYTTELPAWPLARAVAASSCFPPIFNPLPIGLDPQELQDGHYQDPPGNIKSETRDMLVADIRLSDGGVYDNMGLEPVWKTRQNVLVSDGGAAFNPMRDKGLIWRLNRYASIGNNQAEAVRKRSLIQAYKRDQYGGAFWGISSAPSSYAEGMPGYSKPLARHRISEIRTDLDSFSSLEADVLITHGYFLANAAAKTHMNDLIKWSTSPTLTEPDPADEEGLFSNLKGSSRISLLGRGWPW